MAIEEEELELERKELEMKKKQLELRKRKAGVKTVSLIPAPLFTVHHAEDQLRPFPCCISRASLFQSLAGCAADGPVFVPGVGDTLT